MADDLTRHERDLLAQLQQDDTPSPATQARVKERVFAQLGIGVTVGITATALGGGAAKGAAAEAGLAGAGAASKLAVAGGASVASKLSLLKLSLVVAAVGVGGGALVLSSAESSKTTPAPSLAASSVPPPSRASAVTELREPEPLVEETVKEPPAPPQPRRRTSEPRQDKPRAERSNLQEEAQLLARAHRAINSGNPQAGIALLLEHRQRFPAGTLVLERQGALAIAHCQSGQLARGQAQARRFLKQHPKSPMVQRLETACKLSSR